MTSFNPVEQAVRFTVQICSRSLGEDGGEFNRCKNLQEES